MRAESLFTRALTIATAHNNTALANAARGGRAQVRAWQGKWTDAAAMPHSCQWRSVTTPSSPPTPRARISGSRSQTINRREVTVWNTVWVADRDVRTPYDTVRTGSAITKGQDGTTNFFRQRKYLTIGDPVALVRGTEMLLIRAEAALRANDVTNAMTFINQERASFTLPALTATTVDQAWTILSASVGPCCGSKVVACGTCGAGWPRGGTRRCRGAAPVSPSARKSWP